MAPGGVADDEDRKVGFVDILVAAWHDVLTKARMWPATDEAMQSREFESILAVPINPLLSLLATY
jgi:hypothetical protein